MFCEPIAFETWLTGDVVVPVEVMEDDLDSVMQSASRTDRGDVDDTAALESVVDCRIHKSTNRTEYLRIPRHVGMNVCLTDGPTRP
jgi:hypothetical protein